ncbi:MAG: DMT family transporter [Thermoplasmatota archaeon]
MDKQRKAYLFGITAVLIWATVATAFKITLDHMSVLLMLVFSTLTSTLVLFFFIIIRGDLGKLLRFDRREILHSAFLGFMNPFLYYLVLFGAYSRLPAQEAQPLNYTWPIILTLMSIAFLGQKISKMSIAAVSVSFLGVVLISARGIFFEGGMDLPGIALALFSAVIWSSYWILNIRNRRDPAVKLSMNFLFGSIYVLAAGLIFADLSFPGIDGVLASVYVGSFEMGITFILWLAALKMSRDTARISNLIYLSPFLSLVLINLVIGESIFITTILGLSLIVAGIVIQRWSSGRRDARSKQSS